MYIHATSILERGFASVQNGRVSTRGTNMCKIVNFENFGECYCAQKWEFHQRTPHYRTLNIPHQLLVPVPSRASSATTKRSPIALRAPISAHLGYRGRFSHRSMPASSEIFDPLTSQYPYMPMINLNTEFNLTSSLAALNP